jgi:hypothetical protein
VAATDGVRSGVVSVSRSGEFQVSVITSAGRIVSTDRRPDTERSAEHVAADHCCRDRRVARWSTGGRLGAGRTGASIVLETVTDESVAARPKAYRGGAHFVRCVDAGLRARADEPVRGRVESGCL